VFTSQAEALGYLAGVIDGEGSIWNSGNGRGICIVNTDAGLLDAVDEACDMLGIRTRRYERSERARLGRKPIWDLWITGRDALALLAEQLPLRTAKAAKLRAIVSSYRPLPRYDDARRLYDSGQSIGQVAAALGVPWSTAQLWIKRTGPLRPPGRRHRE
jgi:hypothetical protein